MRRRALPLGVAWGLLLAGSLPAGARTDLQVIVLGGSKALRQDPGFRGLRDNATRLRALRETVGLMLSSVDEATMKAADVVAATELQTETTSRAYADRLVATATRLGPAYEEALTSGARLAVVTFQLDGEAAPEAPVRTLLEIGTSLERWSHPAVEPPPASLAPPTVLADASALDVIAREIRDGLQAP
jgi:hypothetical protein